MTKQILAKFENSMRTRPGQNALDTGEVTAWSLFQFPLCRMKCVSGGPWMGLVGWHEGAVPHYMHIKINSKTLLCPCTCHCRCVCNGLCFVGVSVRVLLSRVGVLCSGFGVLQLQLLLPHPTWEWAGLGLQTDYQWAGVHFAFVCARTADCV